VHRHGDGPLVASATDLVGFLACDHLTTLELGAVAGTWPRPHEREDPEVLLLQERGLAHEQAFLARLRAEGRTVVEIARPEPRTPAGYRAAEAETVAAMRAGAGAIYQATLFDGRWLGYADFLLRVERPSPAFGAWSYEVADTKLARSVKASAVLQVCSYSARLATLQGVEPEQVHVVTGDSATTTLRLGDFGAYFRAARSRFETVVDGDPELGVAPRDPRSAATYPDPVDHCRVCAWFPVCIDRRRADDHLSLVAGMTRAATGALVGAGVGTLAELGRLDPARSVADLAARTLGRLREQARIQLRGRELGRSPEQPIHERIPPRPDEPGTGLAGLPEPSASDIFFDIEADPWLDDTGREYLLGVLTVDTGAPAYRALWGHSPADERRAFEAFVDLVMDRLATDPTMHVYHYGAYERAAITRLMSRHSTREEAVDRMLRGGVLVDLFTAVRQGIRASVESYSLKQVEHLFGFVRAGGITRAGFSVVEYEAFLRDGDPAHLDALAAYNRDDTLATLGLRDWLEGQRREAIDEGWDLPRPLPRSGDPGETVAAQAAETAARIAALLAGLPEPPDELDEAGRARRLLAGLLDYHRREAKPEWWRWYELRDGRTAEELVEESDAIGLLVWEADVGTEAKSVLSRFRYPPQDHRFRRGDTAIDPATGSGAGTIVELDDVAGTLVLKRGRARAGERPTALIPATPVPTDALRAGLGRLADHVIEHGIDPRVGGGAADAYRAATDLLAGRAPRIAAAVDGGELRRAGESAADAGMRLVAGLDASTLAIQGPPGTGKTYTGARMVLAALRAGMGPVGVTAQSHKTITNFLEALVAAATETGDEIRILQRCETGDDGSHLPGVRLATNVEIEAAVVAGTVDVVAGTAWLLSRPGFDGRLGLLVVDEAGQLALATVLAMSGAARSILLLGDPNQLAQVTQGLHPPGADASALGHLLGESTTLPPERGLFLDETRRMHPDVNAYVSATFYAGRLGTHASTAGQRVLAPGPAGGTGIRWHPVVHARNEQRSREEAEAVARIVDALIGEPWTDALGVTRSLTIDDLLVVAPYNAHVAEVQRAIETRLGPVAHDRVGTVDKFQGREGAVAIYTMAASSAEDAPRGLDFLYDRHRLNVAVSRARAVAIVVASPALLRVRARTPEQMRLANALARLVEVAEAQARR
jgi:uncharacterized protein